MALGNVTRASRLERESRILPLRHELHDDLKLLARHEAVFVLILIVEEALERFLSLRARNLAVSILVQVFEHLVIRGRLLRLAIRAARVARRATRKQD